MVLAKPEFLLHEYDALRAEIVQRIVIRWTILTLTLTVFGAVFALSTTPSVGAYLLMLYPVLSGFLLGIYIGNTSAIRSLSRFIRDHIEKQVQEADQAPALSTLGWHHQVPRDRIQFLHLSLSYLINNLAFPISSLIAWVVSGMSMSDPKFHAMIRNGIDFTHVAWWCSLLIVVISFVFAVFERRIFERRVLCLPHQPVSSPGPTFPSQEVAR